MLREFSTFFNESMKDSPAVSNYAAECRFLCSEQTTAITKIFEWMLQCCSAGGEHQMSLMPFGETATIQQAAYSLGIHNLEQEMWRRLHNQAEQLISPDDARIVIRSSSSDSAVREIAARSLAKGYQEVSSECDRDTQTKINTLVNAQPESFRNSFRKACEAYDNKAGLARGIENAYGPVQVEGSIITGDGRRVFVAHSRTRSTMVELQPEEPCAMI